MKKKKRVEIVENAYMKEEGLIYSGVNATTMIAHIIIIDYCIMWATLCLIYLKVKI